MTAPGRPSPSSPRRTSTSRTCADFRTMFGLPANDPQIILNGPDPGVLSPSGDES